MWLWQRKSDRNRHFLWLKLLLLSSGCHLIFLWCLFFIYHHDSNEMSLIIRSDLAHRDLPIVILPIKHVGSFSANIAKAQPKKAIIKKTVAVKPIIEKTTIVP